MTDHPLTPPEDLLQQMTNPYRAMCAELLNDLEHSLGQHCLQGEIDNDPLIIRARALLAEPVAEGPTDDKLMDIARATDLVYYMGEDCGFASPYMEGTDITAEVLAYARAVLAKWGTLTPQPVAVSERPWERDGWCDVEGRCYGWDGDYWWMVSNPGTARETITHWLPAHALPTPEAQ